MFDKDNWLEILEIILRNPVRAILAGIGVSWGIFMLIIMVGAGNGLENGVRADMSNRDFNSFFMWSMRTSMPYKGYQPGRNLIMRTGDIDYLKENVNNVEVITPRNQLGGWRGSNNVKRGTKTGAFNVYGDYPEYIRIQPIDIVEGRFLNHGDIDEERRICIIGKAVQKELFAKNEDALGKYIFINSIAFQVVGVYSSFRTGEDADEDEQSIYVPFTTFGKAFRVGDRISWFSGLVEEGKDGKAAFEQTKTLLKEKLSVHPQDARAIGGYSMSEKVEEVSEIFGAIEIIGLVVGALVLMAGIIGIINIMLITIRERTKEFGVRRALGAVPSQIVHQVVVETLFLTLVAGCVGMMAGIGVLELIDWQIGETVSSFRHPTISFQIVSSAMLIMIVAGAVAGLLPAVRAVAIKPVDAIRSEN